MAFNEGWMYGGPRPFKLEQEIPGLERKPGVNVKNNIPVFDTSHKWSSVWDQPNKDFIGVCNDYVVMTQDAADNLANYSHSIPTGFYYGKMWKRHYDGCWYLCWFGYDTNVYYRKILITDLDHWE